MNKRQKLFSKITSIVLAVAIGASVFSYTEKNFNQNNETEISNLHKK